jgi:hypothetical protein
MHPENRESQQRRTRFEMRSARRRQSLRQQGSCRTGEPHARYTRRAMYLGSSPQTSHKPRHAASKLEPSPRSARAPDTTLPEAALLPVPSLGKTRPPLLRHSHCAHYLASIPARVRGALTMTRCVLRVDRTRLCTSHAISHVFGLHMSLAR